jgi:DNA-binding transcriptional regulator GbsR (MarR family)
LCFCFVHLFARAISAETDKEVTQEVARFSENYAEPDIVLMKMAIEIETTLRNIAEQAGLSRTKVSMGMLVRILQQKELITEKWLLEALRFFQSHRNELIHEGKTDDIRDAIDVGREVLAKLREIEQTIGK